MENKHIKNFKVENFKKFDSLEVKNVGLINIVTGDNNIGKTCFLESLLISSDFIKTITYLHYTLKRRGYYFPVKYILNRIEFPEENYFGFIAKSVDNKIISHIIYENNDTESIEMEYISSLKIGQNLDYRFDELEISSDIKGWLKQYSSKKERPEVMFLYYDEVVQNNFYGYYPFISFNVSYSNDVEAYLRELERLRKEEENKATSITYDHKREVIDTMNEIMGEKMNDYQVIDVGSQKMLGISLKDKNEGRFIPITQLGDGFQKIFRYIVEVIYAKSIGESRLMIDEIDTGIHYSKMYMFWKTFVQIAEKYNIQIFATTHSKGCIDEFVNVLNDNEKTELGRIISLQEENKNIRAYTYTTKNLDKSFDYRG